MEYSPKGDGMDVALSGKLKHRICRLSRDAAAVKGSLVLNLRQNVFL